MFKTICLSAIAALAFTQDVAQVTDALSGVTVGQVVQDPAGTVQAAAGAATAANLPILNSVTVGWGNREVVVTPQDANPTANDWFGNGETLNVAQVQGTAADGEWTLNWSVENGDDWALLNNNGELIVVDFVNGEQNLIANLGANDLLDAEVAYGAENLVDYVWSSGETTIDTDDVAANVNNLVGQVWTNQNLQGFLSQQGVTTDSTVGSVVGAVAANPQQAATDAQNAAANAGVTVPQQTVDAATAAVNSAASGTA